MNQIGTVLIVEDDKRIRQHMRNILAACGYKTLEAGRGEEALFMITSSCPDLILLDLGLPDMDGMELLCRLREQNDVPVIVVSARANESEKVTALDNGADDYVTKPFGSDELQTRIRTALRHSRTREVKPNAVYHNNGLVVDSEKHLVLVEGEEVHLTQTEYKILLLLCQNSGKVLTYEYILDHVWGSDQYDTQVLRVNMGKIRRKIEKDPGIPEYIKTEMGVGYRMVEMSQG